MVKRLASVTRFGKILKVFTNILRVYLLFFKILNLLWQKLYAIVQCFQWPNIEQIILLSRHTDACRGCKLSLD